MNCPSCGRENPAGASFCMACTTSLITPAEPAHSPSDTFPVSTGFVGRQWEMGALRAALEDAFSGQGRLVMLMGERASATNHADASITAAQRLRHPFYMARTLGVREFVARILGQWQTAREISDRGLEVSPRECRLLFGRVLAECQLGEIASAEASLDQLVEVMRLNPSGPTPDRSFFCVTALWAARIGNMVDRSDLIQEVRFFVNRWFLASMVASLHLCFALMVGIDRVTMV